MNARDCRICGKVYSGETLPQHYRTNGHCEAYLKAELAVGFRQFKTQYGDVPFGVRMDPVHAQKPENQYNMKNALEVHLFQTFLVKQSYCQLCDTKTWGHYRSWKQHVTGQMHALNYVKCIETLGDMTRFRQVYGCLTVPPPHMITQAQKILQQDALSKQSGEASDSQPSTSSTSVTSQPPAAETPPQTVSQANPQTVQHTSPQSQQPPSQTDPQEQQSSLTLGVSESPPVTAKDCLDTKGQKNTTIGHSSHKLNKTAQGERDKDQFVAHKDQARTTRSSSRKDIKCDQDASHMSTGEGTEVSGPNMNTEMLSTGADKKEVKPCGDVNEEQLKGSGNNSCVESLFSEGQLCIDESFDKKPDENIEKGKKKRKRTLIGSREEFSAETSPKQMRGVVEHITPVKVAVTFEEGEYVSPEFKVSVSTKLEKDVEEGEYIGSDSESDHDKGDKSKHGDGSQDVNDEQKGLKRRTRGRRSRPGKKKRRPSDTLSVTAGKSEHVDGGKETLSKSKKKTRYYDWDKDSETHYGNVLSVNEKTDIYKEFVPVQMYSMKDEHCLSGNPETDFTKDTFTFYAEDNDPNTTKDNNSVQKKMPLKEKTTLHVPELEKQMAGNHGDKKNETKKEKLFEDKHGTEQEKVSTKPENVDIGDTRKQQLSKAQAMLARLQEEAKKLNKRKSEEKHALKTSLEKTAELKKQAVGTVVIKQDDALKKLEVYKQKKMLHQKMSVSNNQGVPSHIRDQRSEPMTYSDDLCDFEEDIFELSDKKKKHKGSKYLKEEEKKRRKKKKVPTATLR